MTASMIRRSLAILSALAIGALPAPSRSATFVVNSVQDDGDANPLDDLCDDGAGNCTLRAAIMQANATGGLDSIAFNIPGAGPHSIRPTTDLPPLSDPALIDGYTEPGSFPNTSPFGQSTNAVPMIEIDGSLGLSGFFNDGFVVTGGNSTIRGLVINRVGRVPISLLSDSNVLEGNFIGTNLNGTEGLGNGLYVVVVGSHNRVGGTDPAARNIISASNSHGILVGDSGQYNVISGNFIGTNAQGTAPLSNQSSGIDIRGSNNEIRANVVSGNSRTFGLGISVGVFGPGSNNIIEGNFIGTAVSGVFPLPNGFAGVYLGGVATGNRIGGVAPGQGNLVAFNIGPGVWAPQGFPTANTISGNSMYSNGGLGIDLGEDGPSPNDPGDAESEPNPQNYPMLATATTSSGIVSVTGLLNSRPSTAYSLEFFSNTECDPSGFGEGRTYLGSVTVQTDAGGTAIITAVLNALASPGAFVTATATDPLGKTSEFSSCVLLTTPSTTDQAPVVFAPASVNGSEGVTVGFQVFALDPDGDPITTLTAEPLPPGATFTPTPDYVSGMFAWVPGFDQAGVYEVTIAAESASRGQPVSAPVEGTATVHLTIGNMDRAPVLTAPPELTVATGTSVVFTVTVSDPDGEAITSLDAFGLPVGATFTANEALSEGTFTWTPSFGNVGVHYVTFVASNVLSAYATTVITVVHENRPPVADAGGPYSGVAGVSIAFDATGSSDPDGDALTFAWSFGDGGTGSGSSPTYAYAAGGEFQVVVTASDGELANEDTTTATVAEFLPARAFLTHSSQSVALSSGLPAVCAQLEPVDGAYRNTDVEVSTIEMVSSGTGLVDRISAIGEKTTLVGDRDGNGIEEIRACFLRKDMRLLLSNLSGRTTVTVAIEARHTSGAIVRGELEMVVVLPAGPLGAAVAPNPMNPRAALSFVTEKSGAVRIRLYDTAGRLIRTLADERSLPSGYHEFPIDGRGSGGERLPSGIYFYLIESAGGTARGRLAILR